MGVKKAGFFVAVLTILIAAMVIFILRADTGPSPAQPKKITGEGYVLSQSNIAMGNGYFSQTDDKLVTTVVSRLSRVEKENDKVYAVLDTNLSSGESVTAKFLVFDKSKGQFFLQKGKSNEYAADFDLLRLGETKDVESELNKLKGNLVVYTIGMSLGKSTFPKEYTQFLSCNDQFYDMLKNNEKSPISCTPFFGQLYVYKK